MVTVTSWMNEVVEAIVETSKALTETDRNQEEVK